MRCSDGYHTSAEFTDPERIKDSLRRCDRCGDRLGDGEFDCIEDVCAAEARKPQTVSVDGQEVRIWLAREPWGRNHERGPGWYARCGNRDVGPHPTQAEAIGHAATAV